LLPISGVNTVEFTGQAESDSPEYSPSILGITTPTVLSGAAILGVIVIGVLLLNPRKGRR
jgi:hypothetical protein